LLIVMQPIPEVLYQFIIKVVYKQILITLP